MTDNNLEPMPKFTMTERTFVDLAKKFLAFAKETKENLFFSAVNNTSKPYKSTFLMIFSTIK